MWVPNWNDPAFQAQLDKDCRAINAADRRSGEIDRLSDEVDDLWDDLPQ